MEVTRFEDFEAYWTERGWGERGPVKIASRIDVPRLGRRGTGRRGPHRRRGLGTAHGDRRGGGRDRRRGVADRPGWRGSPTRTPGCSGRSPSTSSRATTGAGARDRPRRRGADRRRARRRARRRDRLAHHRLHSRGMTRRPGTGGQGVHERLLGTDRGCPGGGRQRRAGPADRADAGQARLARGGDLPADAAAGAQAVSSARDWGARASAYQLDLTSDEAAAQVVDDGRRGVRRAAHAGVRRRAARADGAPVERRARRPWRRSCRPTPPGSSTSCIPRCLTCVTSRAASSP